MCARKVAQPPGMSHPLRLRLAARARRRLLWASLVVAVGGAGIVLVAGARLPPPALDGCELVVHHPTHHPYEYSVSPDGRVAFFLSTEPELVPPEARTVDGFGLPTPVLFAWDAGTRRAEWVRVRAPAGYVGVDYGVPDVARDGRMLAMVAGWQRKDRRPVPTVLLVDRTESTWVEASRGVAPPREPGGPVRISPDGDAVAFLVHTPDAGGSSRAVGAPDSLAVWSREDDRVVDVPLDATQPGAHEPLAFSADGHTLFFLRTAKNTATVHAFDRTTAGVRNLGEVATSFGSATVELADDGRTLVEARNPTMHFGDGSIHVRRHGVDIADITHSAAPTLGDGGRRVAFEDRRGGAVREGPRLLVFDLTTGSVRQPRTGAPGRHRIRGISPRMASESDVVVYRVRERDDSASKVFGPPESIRWFRPGGCLPDDQSSSGAKPLETTIATTTEMTAKP